MICVKGAMNALQNSILAQMQAIALPQLASLRGLQENPNSKASKVNVLWLSYADQPATVPE